MAQQKTMSQRMIEEFSCSVGQRRGGTTASCGGVGMAATWVVSCELTRNGLPTAMSSGRGWFIWVVGPTGYRTRDSRRKGYSPQMPLRSVQPQSTSYHISHVNTPPFSLTGGRPQQCCSRSPAEEIGNHQYYTVAGWYCSGAQFCPRKLAAG